MKALFAVVITALLAPIPDFAQTQVNKSIPVSAGQNILIHFDYPELVRVSTWDKNEVSIQGTVSINNGESDDAFELFTSSSGKTVSIRNEIKDLKSLPQRITVVDGAQKITFKNRAELRKYQEQNGKHFEMISSGVDMEIILDIKVPRNVITKVESVYGMVEVKDFTGPLTVDATYGGVDAALTERATGLVTAETSFGQIYTNLDAKFGTNNRSDDDFETNASAKPGSGPEYSFESKYGNVYIRKATN